MLTVLGWVRHAVRVVLRPWAAPEPSRRVTLVREFGLTPAQAIALERLDGPRRPPPEPPTSPIPEPHG